VDDEQVDDSGLEALLHYVRDERGFDFTGYKRTSLRRRILKRMEALDLDGFETYRECLERDDAEFEQLFNTILINVTRFFRDPDSWRGVADTVIPEILSGKGATDPVRAWVPGCASGEEAYTIAILLCEAMGDAAFRDRVKIYATDLDMDALDTGRRATYPRTALVEAVGEERADRYFEHDGSLATFRPELRRAVIFGRHDLLQDPPISRVDLLSCRNTLMYFTAAAQFEVLARFEFSLRPDGYLLLGKSETLATRSNLFVPVDLKRRIFAARLDRAVGRTAFGRGTERHVEPSEQEIRTAGFDLGQAPQVLVDTEGALAAANQHARVLFGLTMRDVGRPLQDLELSYRPVELRSRIDAVVSERRQVNIHNVEMTAGADVRTFDVILSPVVSSAGVLTGTSISFIEVTPQRQLQQELDRSRAELDTAYEELQSTVEELETTNEELQSTNEELETTNEELQSMNEELETMNEELQSTNEELETINDELRQRTDELNDVNSYLESILTSLQTGVIVVNRDMRIQVWNQQATELWGLRGDEVEGEHLMNLDIGLPVDQLHQPIRACLGGESEVEVKLDAVNRRGRAIACSVKATPLRSGDGTPIGVILVMDAADGQAGPTVV